MITKAERSCHGVRRRLVAALLASPPRREPPAALADHLAACPGCAAFWRHALAVAGPAPDGRGYSPRLRARTLAGVGRDLERAGASPSPWLWFTPAALVAMVAAYGVPAWLLSGVLEAVFGSPALATAIALLIVGSLLMLLPASLAASLTRRAPHSNGCRRRDEKGALS